MKLFTFFKDSEVEVTKQDVASLNPRAIEIFPMPNKAAEKLIEDLLALTFCNKPKAIRADNLPPKLAHVHYERFCFLYTRWSGSCDYPIRFPEKLEPNTKGAVTPTCVTAHQLYTLTDKISFIAPKKNIKVFELNKDQYIAEIVAFNIALINYIKDSLWRT